ncbi:hypothetical protein JYU34_001882 [Plutella xylostella]|uniref:PAT complex subunit CCDC47 n=1 Tax=Plutella xylostella TaxID=51655 RepID=A0ABQ7R530_PLUXY|nr:hypothetical protein JYU34_001882 [Plutella xylostella]
MKISSVLVPVVLVLCGVLVTQAYEDVALEDDDFAEFEQFDAEDDNANDVADFETAEPSLPKPKPAAPDQFQSSPEVEDDILVEDEDNEFEHFQDPEEFEGFQDTPPKTSEQPKITISKVPITGRPRWDAYWLEGALCVLLGAYALAYLAGRARNTALATNLLKLHKPLLEDNFTLVGEYSKNCGSGLLDTVSHLSKFRKT